MHQNIILAGVGGQGILTIAEAISQAALKRGLNVKQAENHGMAQRGGGVQSHLRISDQPIYSDLIGAGQADLLIAVEPLEAVRHLHWLNERGTLVVSSNVFVNIGNYPAVEDLLERIAAHPGHLLLDAERIARAAGSGRAANIAMLGAASPFLMLDAAELEDAVASIFARKGSRVVDANHRAFRFGRNAGRAYMDGLERGGTSSSVRHWLETLDATFLAEPERPDAPVFEVSEVGERLSGAEAHAVERTLLQVYEDERTQLFEHEVYAIVQLLGAITPPHHRMVGVDSLLSDEALERFPGDKVVLKIVSPDIVHKSDAHGVVFVRKDGDAVRAEINALVSRHRGTADVRGVLVVEHVEHDAGNLGSELFVGIRATREFGPVIAAGLGGVDTEYLAAAMKPGAAVAKALATGTTAVEFLELFRETAAYDMLAGLARGHHRTVSDGELLRCFRAFLHLAQRFCVDRGDDGPDVAELEVNPFAFQQQRMVPLDGRGRLGRTATRQAARPIAKVARLLEPRTVAVLGVSSKQVNFGRIILRNLLQCSYPRDKIWVIRPDAKDIDGVRCVDAIADVPEPIDLLVVAAGAARLPELIDEAIDCGRIQSVIIVPGAVGETEGSEGIAAQVRKSIAAAHLRPDGGPVFLGPNSLGVLSRPGRLDTFFIPPSRMDKRWSAPARRVALLSQSGAFIISRMSNLETLDPAFAISIGNQFDLTHSDLVRAVGSRDDVDVVGVYVEGFNDLDGLDLLEVISELTADGTDVVLYRAGRTESGRSAAAGHTASVAGDYDVCVAAARQAGAMVADTFKEFEQLVELCANLHDKTVRGVRVGAVSNAGFETVGMADAIQGARYKVSMATLGEATTARLADAIARNGLAGLINARNPLDITPMAGEPLYEDAVRVLLDTDEVDAVVVGIVPLTAALMTGPGELHRRGSLIERLPRLSAMSDKPMVVVIDSGPLYEPLAFGLRAAGLPVFRSADQAIRSLGRYLCHRAQVPAKA